jgi:hypothetical protein
MNPHRAHLELLRLRAPQRDSRTVDAKLERIAAERRPQERELGALNETEHHEALHGGIGRLDRIDADAIAGL